MEGGEAREGGPGPDRRGTARAARAARCVHTGEAPGSLTRGTQPPAGEGGRREAQGRVGRPGKKQSGPSPNEQESL
jgi:hypothetical protein